MAETQQKRTSQARGARRREQVLQAALACFSEQGFGATTVEQIRRRSGASTGSIYHLFGGKQELAVELYLEGLRDYQAGFTAELSRHRSARAGTGAMVRFHLGWVREHPDWARYLFQMRQAAFVQASEERIAQLNAGFHEQVAAWLGPHVRAGRIRRFPRDLYPSLLLGPCQEFARAWLAGKTRTGWDRARRELSAAVWRCVGLEP